MTALIDATAARRQLQSLAACGFTLTYLAARIGMSAQGLGDIRRGTHARSSPYIATGIERVYGELRDVDPTDCRITPGAAAWTRLLAARAGWTADGGVAA
jgi:hypothetical protein